MKGFKKDGKFRPTGIKRRSPLTVSQIRDKTKLEMQQGFKVYPNTKIKSVHEELPPEIVERVQYLWNKDPHMKKMRKHVDYIDLGTDIDSPNLGEWDEIEKRFTLEENYSTLEAELTTVHEIVGHAFWDWARVWRREELTEFNELANSMPPINDYVETFEKKWRDYNDDEDKLNILKNDHDVILRNNYDPNDPDEDYQNEVGEILDYIVGQVDEIEADEGHKSMTRYANETHSAMTELIYGVGEQERKVFLNDEQLEALTDAWYKLHA